MLILLLFLPLLCSGGESYTKLSDHNVHDLSCFVGLCFVSEGCEGHSIWKRVLAWPKWDENPKNCKHAFMIRRNIDPSASEKFPKELVEVLTKQGEEYFIVFTSGGPSGPAREFRMETAYLKPIFSVWHENFKSFQRKDNRTKWKVSSYDFQTINKTRFEAGLMVDVKDEDLFEDFCIFIHNRASMQHICGGLEHLFMQLPSKRFPMKYSSCQDDLNDGFTIGDDGFFHCKAAPRGDNDKTPQDFVLKTTNNSMPYVRMHHAFCAGGQTYYLVDHHSEGFLAFKYDSRQLGKVECGDRILAMDARCKVPALPSKDTESCGSRCVQAGIATHPKSAGNVLKCNFMHAVVDGAIYSTGDEPLVTCDPSGWWRYKMEHEDTISKWVDSIFCFYQSSTTHSDCVLDSINCGKVGECPIHKTHQVDCDGNPAGLVLAVFHPGYDNGYEDVEKLGCDKKNRWWTVKGKSLPRGANVECVWPLELKILEGESNADMLTTFYEPEDVDPRALSEVGPTVRNSFIVIAVVSLLLLVMGYFYVDNRLQGPKTRMLTREVLNLYPSLLNEGERAGLEQAQAKYRRVHQEGSLIALHETYQKLYKEKDAEKDNAVFTLDLEKHWNSLNWSTRHILLERAMLIRAFFGLKVLYYTFDLNQQSDMNSFEIVRPGLKEKITRISTQYKKFIANWSAETQMYSLAFASLTKDEMEGYRTNGIKRTMLREMSSKPNEQVNETDAPVEDPSKRTKEASTPPATTAPVPTTTLETAQSSQEQREKTAGATVTATAGGTMTATAGETGNGESDKKIEEKTAPAPSAKKK